MLEKAIEISQRSAPILSDPGGGFTWAGRKYPTREMAEDARSIFRAITFGMVFSSGAPAKLDAVPEGLKPFASADLIERSKFAGMMSELLGYIPADHGFADGLMYGLIEFCKESNRRAEKERRWREGIDYETSRTDYRE